MAMTRADAADPASVAEVDSPTASASVLLLGADRPDPEHRDGAPGADRGPDPLAPLEGLLRSSDLVVTLASHGVAATGTGASRDRSQASLRLRVRLPGGAERGISILAGVVAPEDAEETSRGSGTAEAPGTRLFSPSALREQIRSLRAEHRGELIIAAAHRRDGGSGADTAQRAFARQVTLAGADLVIGHGSPAAQEIDIVNSRLVLHGIGPGLSAPQDEVSEEHAAPFDVAVGVHLTERETQLRVYPLVADGPGRRARSRPVTAEQFEQFYLSSLARTRSSAAFLRAIGTGQDAQGHFLDVPLSRRHRVRVNRHRRGIGTTMTYWEPEPVEIEFDRRYSNSRYVLERELLRQGASLEHLEAGTITGRSSSGEPYLLTNSITHHTGVPASRAVKYKDLARRILEEAGAAVASGGRFDRTEDLDRAAELMHEIGPVVVKPVDGNIGRGVTVGVDTVEHLRSAWTHAFSQTRSGVLIEQQFEGDEFRISVVDGVACAATRRVPPQITGDGERTIRELINDRNDERHRHLVLHSKPLDLTGSRLRRLLEAGMTPLSVLPAGQTYVIDRMGSVGSGAHPVHCLEDIDPSYLRSAERAARAFPDLDMAGIDMLCADTSVPARTDNHIIIEVNSKPEIATHAAAPSPRAPRSFPTLLVDSALSPRTPGPFRARIRRPRAPESPTSARLLAAELAARGMDITWWNEEYFHARADRTTVSIWRAATDRTGRSAQTATRHPGQSRALLRRAHLPVPAEDAEGSEDAGDAGAADWPRLRLLVAHGRVLAALSPGGAGRRDALRDVHASHRAVAAAAAQAFPGLDLAEVTLAVKDPRRPAVRTETVVENVAAEPDLAVFAAAAGRRRDIIRTIIDLHLGSDRPAPEGEVSWAASSAPPRSRPRALASGLRRRARRLAGSTRRRA